MFERNIQTSEGCVQTSEHWLPVQTSVANVRRRGSPMAAKVSLFQVAEVPKNMYDYTLPKSGLDTFYQVDFEETNAIINMHLR